MDGTDKKGRIPISEKKRQTSATENAVTGVSYLRNFTEATVLFWRVPNFSALQCKVLYNQIFEVQGLRCDFKLLKLPETLYLCVYSEAFTEKIAEFLLVDGKKGNPLKCPAKELFRGCYVGEFQHPVYVNSSYVRNNKLTVAFKYFTFQSIYCQDTLSEAAEPLTDAAELCSDYRRAFMTGLLGDFIIRASGYQFTTHRFILAAHSEFFDDFFQDNPNANEYTCKNDIPPSAMHEILLFMYSGELKETNLKFMLCISDLSVEFNIKSLSQKCGRYFLRCIEWTCRMTTKSNGGQDELDIGLMRIICEEAFNYKPLQVFANKCARYLKRNLDKFLHLETCPSTSHYKVNLDDMIQLWRLSYVRKLKDIRNQCEMILWRCMVDPICFDAYVTTGKGMGVNLKGVIHVAEFAQEAAVLRKRSVQYIFDHFGVDQTNVTPNDEVSMQTVSRILNIALKEHYLQRALVDKCLGYMRSHEKKSFLNEDLTSLIEVACAAKKMKKNDFLAECLKFLKKYFVYYGETYLLVEEGDPFICLFRSTIKLHELSLDISLRRQSLISCHKIVKGNRLRLETQDALRENIDLFNNMVRLSRKLKLINHREECDHTKRGKDRIKMKQDCHKFNVLCPIYKKDCVNYTKKIMDAFRTLSSKEILSDNTLKYMAFPYKVSRRRTSFKKAFIDIIEKQINLRSKESDNLTLDHKLDALISICNISRKLHLYEQSQRCMEILEQLIGKLNSSIRECQNPETPDVLKASCIEPVLRIYKVLLWRSDQRKLQDEQEDEQKDEKKTKKKTKKKQGTKNCSEEILNSRKRKINIEKQLQSQCEDFFNQVLSKIENSNTLETEKAKVMKCSVDICDLTSYHFKEKQMTKQLQKHGTRCHNINLRLNCLRFLAVNLSNDTYKSLAKPSQELDTEFMTKLCGLACELKKDIKGEMLIMKNDEKRCQLPATSELLVYQTSNPMEESHVKKLLEYCTEFFEKIREIDISKVPNDIRKRYVARGMKLMNFAGENAWAGQQSIKSVFYNYMFLGGSKAFVGREETVNFDEACKIMEFAHKTKTEDLQNKCIDSYFKKLTNKKNWKKLHELGQKLGSHPLKNVALQNRNL